MSDKQTQTTIVPVFPLPDTVLFPGQLLPLHLFESRYRDLARDVVGGDGRVAIALLRPGYEDAYFTSTAPIHTVVGLGRVTDWERLADGKYNMLVKGCRRARILAEHDGRTYRRADLQLLGDAVEVSERRLRCARDKFTRVIRERLTCNPDGQAKLLGLLADGTPLGCVADMLAAIMPVAGEARQLLLAQTDPAERARMLCEWICQLTRGSDDPRPCHEWELN